MPSRAEAPGDAEDEARQSLTADARDIPEWKRQSIERSLRNAKLRARQQSDRLVEATIQLLLERGNTDFTVQDVVDHSRMSIRTFYRFFASKDDLLVAVHHTVISTFVEPELQARCNAEPDPGSRLRVYIEGMFEIVAASLPVARALTVYYHRLLETRPADLEAADRPQVDLIASLLRGAAAAGCIDTTLEVDRAAILVHRTVLAVVHSQLLGSASAAATSVDDVFGFCARGVGLKL